ncbi:hypothetical protein P7K49_024526, partial [Saguinus oedipus]
MEAIKKQLQEDPLRNDKIQEENWGAVVPSRQSSCSGQSPGQVDLLQFWNED